MATYKLISQPEGLAISLSDAKRQLSIAEAETFWDQYITNLIGIATEIVQDMTWRSLLVQGWKYLVDTSEMKSTLLLVKCPVISIDSVKYIDSNGDLQNVDASTYQTDVISEPARVVFSTLPSAKSETLNSLQINFTSGYSRTLTDPVLCTAVNLTTNVFTKAAHGLRNGDIVQFPDLGTVTGISLETDYYIINKTTDTFKVSATLNGSAVDLTGADTTPPTYQNQQVLSIPGPIKEAIQLLIGDYYLHREDSSYAPSTSIINSAQKILGPYMLTNVYQNLP
ncbi:MAG: phage head-tail connector protein [Bacteroidia bacterium]